MDKRSIFGLLLVLIGALFLFENFGYLEIPDIVFSWPIILIVIGLFNLVNGNFRASLIFFVISGFFLLHRYTGMDMRDWWPLILIVFGVFFIFRNTGSKKGEVSDDSFDEVNIFGGSNKKVVSQNFKGGKVTSVFGGSEIDLRKSKVEGTAELDVFTMFGGCDIKIPEDWNVKVDMVSIFGGFDDKRGVTENEGSPQLRIKGFTMFGGGELSS